MQNMQMTMSLVFKLIHQPSLTSINPLFISHINDITYAKIRHLKHIKNRILHYKNQKINQNQTFLLYFS